jgi:hypothetical protein
VSNLSGGGGSPPCYGKFLREFCLIVFCRYTNHGEGSVRPQADACDRMNGLKSGERG